MSSKFVSVKEEFIYVGSLKDVFVLDVSNLELLYFKKSVLDSLGTASSGLPQDPLYGLISHLSDLEFSKVLYSIPEFYKLRSVRNRGGFVVNKLLHSRFIYRQVFSLPQFLIKRLSQERVAYDEVFNTNKGVNFSLFSGLKTERPFERFKFESLKDGPNLTITRLNFEERQALFRLGGYNSFKKMNYIFKGVKHFKTPVLNTSPNIKKDFFFIFNACLYLNQKIKDKKAVPRDFKRLLILEDIIYSTKELYFIRKYQRDKLEIFKKRRKIKYFPIKFPTKGFSVGRKKRLRIRRYKRFFKKKILKVSGRNKKITILVLNKKPYKKFRRRLFKKKLKLFKPTRRTLFSYNPDGLSVKAAPHKLKQFFVKEKFFSPVTKRRMRLYHIINIFGAGRNISSIAESSLINLRYFKDFFFKKDKKYHRRQSLYYKIFYFNKRFFKVKHASYLNIRNNIRFRHSPLRVTLFKRYLNIRFLKRLRRPWLVKHEFNRLVKPIRMFKRRNTKKRAFSARRLKIERGLIKAGHSYSRFKNPVCPNAALSQLMLFNGERRKQPLLTKPRDFIYNIIKNFKISNGYNNIKLLFPVGTAVDPLVTVKINHALNLKVDIDFLNHIVDLLYPELKLTSILSEEELTSLLPGKTAYKGIQLKINELKYEEHIKSMEELEWFRLNKPSSPFMSEFVRLLINGKLNMMLLNKNQLDGRDVDFVYLVDILKKCLKTRQVLMGYTPSVIEIKKTIEMYMLVLLLADIDKVITSSAFKH